MKWLRSQDIPIFCMQADAAYLQRKSLKINALKEGEEQAFLNGRITPIPCIHGRGLVGRMMAHGHGFFIALPDEPSLYIAGGNAGIVIRDRCGDLDR